MPTHQPPMTKRQRVRSRYVIDTSAVLHPYFAPLAQALAESKEATLVVSASVLKALEALASDAESATGKAAARTLRLVQSLKATKRLQVDTDPTADAQGLVGSLVGLVKRLSRKYVVFVLTNQEAIRQEVDTQVVRWIDQGEKVNDVYFRHVAVNENGRARLVKDSARNPYVQRVNVIGRWLRRRRSATDRRARPEVRVSSPISIELTEGSLVYPGGEAILTLGDNPSTGGEGRVFPIRNAVNFASRPYASLLCKIYDPRYLLVRIDGSTRPKEDKIQAMIRGGSPSDNLAWPVCLVYDEAKQFRGFLMSRLDAPPLSGFLYDHAWFLEQHPDWTRANSTRLAIHLVQTLKKLHSRGFLVGDLKPENILFQKNRVELVDCDSFQLPGFPCEVGDPRFLTPRLQEVKDGHVERQVSDELFAVAVLLFINGPRKS
jgi:hypothetical protein